MKKESIDVDYHTFPLHFLESVQRFPLGEAMLPQLTVEVVAWYCVTGQGAADI